MPTIALADAEFYYELHGAGPPLVLIAGYTCSHLLWQPLIELLAPHYQLLLFDNRGVGRTKDASAPLSIASMAGDTLALAEKLGFSKPHIAGQSMGGGIAQYIAAHHGDKIGKVILIVTLARCREALLQALLSHIVLREKDLDFDTLFAVAMPWFYGEAFLRDEEKMRLLKESFLNDPYPQSLDDQKRQYHALAAWDGVDLLPRIESETLICYGTQDIASLPSQAQQLAASIPHCQIQSFDTGHGLITEKPELLSETLIRFIG